MENQMSNAHLTTQTKKKGKLFHQEDIGKEKKHG